MKRLLNLVVIGLLALTACQPTQSSDVNPASPPVVAPPASPSPVSPPPPPAQPPASPPPSASPPAPPAPPTPPPPSPPPAPPAPPAPPPAPPPPAGSSVSFVSSSDAVRSGITSLNLVTPSAVQNGDTLIAVLVVNAFVTSAIIAPSGWKTLAGYPLDESGTLVKSTWVFQKTADASTTGNQFSFASTNARGVLLAYRGVRTMREAHRVNSNGVKILTTPSLETVKDALVVSIVSLSPVNHERGVFSLQPLNARFDIGTSRDLTIYAADRLQIQTGPSGELRFESRDDSGAAYSGTYTAVTIALEP